MAVLACHAACSPARLEVEPTGYPGLGTCVGFESRTQFELALWRAEARDRLQQRSRRGAVAVRRVSRGCRVELELLPGCIGKHAYQFVPHPEAETRIVHSIDELFARMPLGAESQYQFVRAGRVLRTDYAIAGRFELPSGAAISRADLQGPGCSAATHVISRLYVGGFVTVVGETASVVNAPRLFRPGLNAEAKPRFVRQTAAGSPQHCEQAMADRKPHAQCSVPLRVVLVPLEDRTRATAASPSVAASPRVTDRRSDAEPPVTRMIQIPPGYCYMGTEDHELDERPSHSVKMLAFDLDATEVTVAQYDACVAAGSCSHADQGEYCNGGMPDRQDHPINCVDWNQARTYCAWANKRLPTETEWECVARYTDGREYPWGDSSPASQPCWKRWSTRHGTCPVGSHQSDASPLEVLDLGGNVSEWTATQYCDSYDDRPYCTQARVLRGGNWVHEDASDIRAANRHWHLPSLRSAENGFRCARDPG